MDTTRINHNNSGHKYRIAVDIAKEGSHIWDLTPYFKGRVGDNNFGLQVTWYYQGQLMNVVGMKPYIEGLVGQYSFGKNGEIDMDPDAVPVRYDGSPDDCEEAGKATFYFPSQMFPKEGIFKGFIGVKDDRDGSKNPQISGVTIWFKVLPGIAQMGHACDAYVDELDKALQNFKDRLDQHDKDYQSRLQQVIDDARNAYNNQTKLSHDASVAAQAEADKVRQDLKSLSNEIGQQQDYINAHNIVTTDKFTNLSNELTKYVTESFIQPEAYDNLDDLKNAYPAGAKGIFVTNDNGHFYVFQNGNWKDCGAFQSSGLADESVTVEKLSPTLQNGFYADVTEISPVHLNTGYMSQLDGKIILTTEGNPIYTDSISVKPDEEYYVYTYNFWNGKAVIFLQNGKVIKALPAESDNQLKNLKITIPHNCDSIVVNGIKSFSPRIFKVNYYFEIPYPLKSVANLVENQNYNFEDVELTKFTEFGTGYWSISSEGNFAPIPADKTRALISYVPIKVEPFEVYRLTGCSGFDARMYEIIDSRGKLVSFCSNEYSSNLTETFMIPENGAYLEINELLLNTNTKLEKAVSIKEKLSLSGKKWTAIGDSWTQIFSDTHKSYVDFVADKTGLIATNSGGGGTAYMGGGPDNWNYQFYKHKIAENSDIVTVFGSFNDLFEPTFDFGQKGDNDTNTMWGAMQATLDNIYSKAFDAHVGIIAPGPWGSINSHLTSDDKVSKYNSNGKYKDMAIKDFAEQYVQTLRDFANLNSLPFLDLYHHSGLRPWDDKFVNAYYHGENDTDSAHPNARAMEEIIAPKIAKFIESFA